MKLTSSVMPRIQFCPGSARFTIDVDKSLAYNPFIDQATAGKSIHKIARKILSALLSGNKPISISKELISAGIKKNSLAFNIAKHTITEYVTYIKKLNKQAKKNGVVTIASEYHINYNFEQTECITIIDCLIMTNMIDRVIIDIIDLKTGNYDYTQTSWPQLSFSAILVAINHVKSDKKPIETNLHIVQPNFWDESKRIVVEPFYDDKKRSYRILLENIIESIEYASDKFISGDHCRLCPGIVSCPAMLRFSAELPGFIDTFDTHEALSKMPIDRLEYLWSMQGPFVAFLQAVDQQVLTRLKSGEVFNTLRIEERKGHRRWTDEKKVIKRLKHLGNKIYEPAKLKSPAQLEKIAGSENIKALCSQSTIYKVSKFENPFPLDDIN